MKNLKSKLMTSVVMLVVAAVLMSTASYAWLTISTNPEVANIKSNVTANGNLEIALDDGTDSEPDATTLADAGKNETWGNLVDLKKFFSGTNDTTVTMKPVQLTVDGTTNTISMKNAGFALDGRPTAVSALNRVQAADSLEEGDFKDLGGIWVYTDNGDAESQAAGTADAGIYAFEIDYWLRTNKAGTVSLSAPALWRAQDAADQFAGESGLGSYITDKSNVSIILQVISNGSYQYFSLVRGDAKYEAKADGMIVKANYASGSGATYVEAGVAGDFVLLASGKYACVAASNAEYLTAKYLSSGTLSETEGTYVLDINGNYLQAAEKNSKLVKEGAFIKNGNEYEPVTTFYVKTGTSTYKAVDAQYVAVSKTEDSDVFVKIEGVDTKVEGAVRVDAAKYPLTLKEIEISGEGFAEKAGGATAISLDANVAKEVKMFVYLDGDVLTNADMLLDAASFNMNIQFTHDDYLNALDVDMQDHGRT